MRFGVQPRPVGNEHSNTDSNRIDMIFTSMPSGFYMTPSVEASFARDGKGTYGKVNVYDKMRIISKEAIGTGHSMKQRGKHTGNIGFMYFARRPFLLMSNRWGVRPRSR